MEFGSYDDGRQWCSMSKEEFDKMGVGFGTNWAMSFSRTTVEGHSQYSLGGSNDWDDVVTFRDCAAALAFALEHRCWWLVEAVQERLLRAERGDFLHHYYDDEEEDREAF